MPRKKVEETVEVDTIKNIKHDQTRKNLSQKYEVNI